VAGTELMEDSGTLSWDLQEQCKTSSKAQAKGLQLNERNQMGDWVSCE
jgi:hypothetical protein